MIPATRIVSASSSRVGVLISSVRYVHRTLAVESTENDADVVRSAMQTQASARENGRKLQREDLQSHDEPLAPFRALDEHTGERKRNVPMKKLQDVGDLRPMAKTKYTSSLARQNAIRPAVQSARVKELTAQEKFGDAITLVYSAPRHTLNASTWNTLLKELMVAGKRKEAYKVYIEVSVDVTMKKGDFLTRSIFS